jgi:hypothetical protein
MSIFDELKKLMRITDFEEGEAKKLGLDGIEYFQLLQVATHAEIVEASQYSFYLSEYGFARSIPGVSHDNVIRAHLKYHCGPVLYAVAILAGATNEEIMQVLDRSMDLVQYVIDRHTGGQSHNQILKNTELDSAFLPIAYNGGGGTGPLSPTFPNGGGGVG